VTAAQIKFEYMEKTYAIMSFWYKVCLVPIFGDKGGSLISALSLVCLMWAIGYILYRKKIYIKL
jgi:predicted acyltransferase